MSTQDSDSRSSESEFYRKVDEGTELLDIFEIDGVSAEDVDQMEKDGLVELEGEGINTTINYSEKAEEILDSGHKEAPDKDSQVYSLKDIPEETFEDLTEGQKAAFVGAVRDWENDKIAAIGGYSTKSSASQTKCKLAEKDLLEKEGRTRNAEFFVGSAAVNPEDDTLEDDEDVVYESLYEMEGTTGEVLEIFLEQEGEAIQRDLVNSMDVSQPTVSNALIDLEEEGMIEKQKEGKSNRVIYRDETENNLEPILKRLADKIDEEILESYDSPELESMDVWSSLNKFNEDHFWIFFYTGAGKDINEIREEMPENDNIMKKRDHLEPFLDKEGDKTINYKVNDRGVQYFTSLMGHVLMHSGEEGFRDNIDNKREEENFIPDIVDYLSENKSASDEQIISQEDLAQDLGIPYEDIPEKVGRARDMGYKIVRRPIGGQQGENREISIEYFGTKGDVHNSSPVNLTGEALWKKVSQGNMTGELLEKNTLLKSGSAQDTPSVDNTKGIAKQNGGEIEYDKYAEKMDGRTKDILNALAFLDSTDQVRFEEDKMVFPEFETDIGWNDYS